MIAGAAKAEAGMEPGEIEALFTRGDGQYLFARWDRPIVPVVFGVDDASLSVFKGAFEAVVTLAGHKMAETDPELGANLMVFAFREWGELMGVRDLGRLVPELEALVARLEAAGANQYRIFRFDPSGAIKAAFVFLKMDAALAGMEAETLALAQAAQTVLLWSDRAFDGTSPLGMTRCCRSWRAIRPMHCGWQRGSDPADLPARGQRS
jgi:hypothetical protein